MSAGPANALRESEAGGPHIARSAVVVGTARLGEGSLLAEGAVIRSDDAAVEVGTGSAVLENRSSDDRASPNTFRSCGA